MTDIEMLTKLLKIIYLVDRECNYHSTCNDCPYDNTMLCGLKREICTCHPLPQETRRILLQELETFYTQGNDFMRGECNEFKKD